MKNKRFSLKSSIQIGIQLLERFQVIHEIGYLHLDLKPDNILIKSSDKNSLDCAKIILIDFGVSK